MLLRGVNGRLIVARRVEGLVPALGYTPHEVHFSLLRKAIKRLQLASAKLDIEKHEAEETFRKLLGRLRVPVSGGRQITSFLHWVSNWERTDFGICSASDNERKLLSLHATEPWQGWLAYASTTDPEESVCAAGYKHECHLPICELIQAAKRIRRVNKKLKAFEQGFISEGGLKDREWYKHLGVAPGKWLGKCWSLSFNSFLYLVMARNRLRCDHFARAD